MDNYYDLFHNNPWLKTLTLDNESAYEEEAFLFDAILRDALVKCPRLDSINIRNVKILPSCFRFMKNIKSITGE